MNRRWAAALAASLLAWMILPWMRPVCEALRSWSLLIPFTALLAAGIGAWMIPIWSRLVREGAHARLAASAAILAATVIAAHRWIVLPEERFHFFAMAVIAWYWMRAWDNGSRPRWLAAAAAAVTTAGVGIVEENIQRFVPGRIFDLRDVWMNVFAAGVSVLWLTISLQGNQRRGRGS